MDNFHIDVTSEGDLAPVMALAFGTYRTAIGYAIRDIVEGVRWSEEECQRHPSLWRDWKTHPRPRRIVFYWSKTENRADIVALPFKLDAAGAADFAKRWLHEENYGSQPDHDGDNGKGWRVYNESWGHVDGDWSAFVAVSPAWAMYGK